MGKKPFISIVNQYFNRFPFRKINIALEPSKDLKIIVDALTTGGLTD